MSGLPRRQRNRLEKAKRIRRAGLTVFSEAGYLGASMDVIAARAGVSKPTLYEYFGSKKQLFSAILVEARDQMLAGLGEPRGSDMVAELHAFAWRYAETVLKPEFLSLARLIISEAQRFPEVGRAYQEAGPDRLLAALMRYLEHQRRAGRLEFEDADLAAEDLWSLILSGPRNRALHVPDDIPDSAAVARTIDNGLKVFLKAYSSRPAKDLAALRVLKARHASTG